MSVRFLPFLLGMALFIAVARSTFSRARHRNIDDVILFLRKLGMVDLELLMDPGEEWTLRHFLTEETFRAAQHERIRLASEYLHRIAHNAEVIQLWMSSERALINDKDELTEKESLVLDLLRVATEVRIYSRVALMKLWFWKLLRAERWPAKLVPGLAGLRVTRGTNVVAAYGQLTEMAILLSLGYGQSYKEKMSAAL